MIENLPIVKECNTFFFKGGKMCFNPSFDIHSSRLYQYYLKSKDYFDYQFKKLEK